MEEDIQGAVVQNFLSEKQTDSEDENTQKLYTSSDTVNELLRGLSAIKPDTAILKLSEETADVLPTFSRVLDDSSTLIDRGIFINLISILFGEFGSLEGGSKKKKCPCVNKIYAPIMIVVFFFPVNCSRLRDNPNEVKESISSSRTEVQCISLLSRVPK